MQYRVIATDHKYFLTDGETEEVVLLTKSEDYAKSEAERIRKANCWGTAWAEDENGNVIG